MTSAIVLTLQKVRLRYYYYCGLPLQYYCLKHVCLQKEKNKNMVGLFCMYGYQFLYGKLEKDEYFRMLSKSTEMHGRQQHIHLIAI